jgi:hypothetical protein
MMETMNESIRVMSQERIDKLNAQMTDGKTAYEVARENGLELIRWDDESGGLYEDYDGYRVYGWEYGEAGFDNQV